MTGIKNRPALILLATEIDITVAFISTQLKGASTYDLLVQPSFENGLKKDSLIRVSKIATLDKEIILGKLGSLSMENLKEIDLLLINAFSIRIQ